MPDTPDDTVSPDTDTDAVPTELDDGTLTHDAVHDVPDRDARMARLSDGADELRNNRGSFIDRTGILLIISGVLVTLGLSLIIVAWSGTAGSIHVEEQIPYVVSGGLLGSTLAIIGALCLFTHWLTIGIREARAREHRAQRRHDELLEALARSGAGPFAEGGNNGHAPGARRQRPLRSAPRRS